MANPPPPPCAATRTADPPGGSGKLRELAEEADGFAATEIGGTVRLGVLFNSTRPEGGRPLGLVPGNGQVARDF